MANGRNSSTRGDKGRDSGGFVALPWSVLDSSAYNRLSHPARSLLIEFARQYVRDNNGRLLASRAYLLKRGWKSAAVIDRAKRELLQAGFIHETVKGHRPNKASWYAVTWRVLDRLPGYDFGASETFRRGAYRTSDNSKDAALIPSRGTGTGAVAPSRGPAGPARIPSPGPMADVLISLPVPPGGHHLEKPSAQVH